MPVLTAFHATRLKVLDSSIVVSTYRRQSACSKARKRVRPAFLAQEGGSAEEVVDSAVQAVAPSPAVSVEEAVVPLAGRAAVAEPIPTSAPQQPSIRTFKMYSTTATSTIRAAH